MLWFKNNPEELRLRNEARIAAIDLQARLQKAKVDSLIKAYKSGLITQVDSDELTGGMTNTWKDEFFLALFSAPLIMAFIPMFQDDVANAFMIIQNNLPDFYIDALLIMLTIVWGARRVVELVLPLRRKKPLATGSPK